MKQDFFRLLSELPNVGYALVRVSPVNDDPEIPCRIVECNQAFIKMLGNGMSSARSGQNAANAVNGMDSRHAVGLHQADDCHPLDSLLPKKLTARLSASLQHDALESFDLYTDAAGKWLRIAGQRCEDGLFLLQLLDVTNEYLYRQGKEKYRLIFENTPLGILHFDQYGRITACNDNLVRIVGSSRSALDGLDMFTLPDQKLKAALCDALQGQIAVYEGEYQSYTVNKLTPVKIIFAPICVEEEAEGGVAIVEDITERLSSEEALVQSTETWKAIITASPDGIGLISLDGRLQFVSEKLADMYGYDSSERESLVGSWIIDFIDPSFHGMLTSNICILLAGKRMERPSEYLAIKRDGTRFFVEVSSSVLPDSKGRPNSILIIERDISKRKHAEETLRLSEERHVAIFDESPIAIELFNAEGNLIHANNACLELFGVLDINELTGFRLFDDPNVSESIKSELRQNKHVRYEMEFDFDLVRANQLYVTTQTGKMHLDISIKSMLNDRKIDGYIVQILDITQQKAAQERIEYLSYRDELTGLYNRRFFEEELLRLDNGRNLPLTLIMADVNGLKLVNDAFGHNMGDQLLKKAAHVISSNCRNDEIIARIGGDEFVVLLPKTGEEEAFKLIERIRRSTGGEHVGVVEVSVSFGAAQKGDIADDVQAVLRTAEERMYRHKLYESALTKRKTVQLIMEALQANSARERLHASGVGSLCEIMALGLGLSVDEARRIATSGHVHDIGKVAVEAGLLHKTDPLTTEEWEQLQRHPEIGYKILSSSSEYAEHAQHVLEHHEWWNGSGYPKGLSGNEISLEARILSIVDAFDAMTGERAYRKRLSADEALQELLRGSGTQFDPSLIATFNELYRNRRFTKEEK